MIISEPKTIPSPKEARHLVPQLEQDLRYNPDSTYADAGVLSIVRAYADGKLIPVAED